MRGIDGWEYLAIFCGGFVGAIARVWLVQELPHGDATWPWPTFIANVTGALLLGYFSTRLQERLPVSTYRRPLLGTGLCGALTTFSTLQLELVTLFSSHHFGLLLAYLVATLAAGFLAVWFAASLVRRARVAVSARCCGSVSDFLEESDRCCALRSTEPSPSTPGLTSRWARWWSICPERSCLGWSAHRDSAPRRRSWLEGPRWVRTRPFPPTCSRPH